MNKQEKLRYIKELRRQYNSKLAVLFTLYGLLFLTLFTIIIPLILLIPIIMTHNNRNKLKAEMFKYGVVEE